MNKKYQVVGRLVGRQVEREVVGWKIEIKGNQNSAAKSLLERLEGGWGSK